jgi:hypothetical protein
MECLRILLLYLHNKLDLFQGTLFFQDNIDVTIAVPNYRLSQVVNNNVVRKISVVSLAKEAKGMKRT